MCKSVEIVRLKRCAGVVRLTRNVGVVRFTNSSDVRTGEIEEMCGSGET